MEPIIKPWLYDLHAEVGFSLSMTASMIFWGCYAYEGRWYQFLSAFVVQALACFVARSRFQACTEERHRLNQENADLKHERFEMHRKFEKHDEKMSALISKVVESEDMLRWERAGKEILLARCAALEMDRKQLQGALAQSQPAVALQQGKVELEGKLAEQQRAGQEKDRVIAGLRSELDNSKASREKVQNENKQLRAELACLDMEQMDQERGFRDCSLLNGMQGDTINRLERKVESMESEVQYHRTECRQQRFAAAAMVMTLNQENERYKEQIKEMEQESRLTPFTPLTPLTPVSSSAPSSDYDGGDEVSSSSCEESQSVSDGDEEDEDSEGSTVTVESGASDEGSWDLLGFSEVEEVEWA